MSGSIPIPIPVPVLSKTSFREMYPEFKDAALYSPYMVDLFLSIAIAQLDPLRWGSGLYQLGVGLFTAHNLIIARRNGASGLSAGQSGLVSSKTLGKAAIDYDTANTAIKNGGPFNLTTYGTQFLYYAQMVGSGGYQSTGPYLGPIYPLSAAQSFPWVAG